jgi:hypothetical protein
MAAILLFYVLSKYCLNKSCMFSVEL